MNVLASALNSIASLIPNVEVTIEKSSLTTIKGVARETTESIKAFAQIQPLNQSEVEGMGVGLSGATFIYRFYFIGDNVAIVNAFIQDKASTTIQYKNQSFNIYAKTDWSANGWIEVVGACSKDIS